MQKKIIIAVDGYSSCGKSTLARELAAKIGYTYIDSGAMYRAATLYFMENNIDVEMFQSKSQTEQENILNEIKIEFQFNKEKNISEIILNGKKVEKEIRMPLLSEKVSPVSTIALLRQKMVAMQRKLGEGKCVVMDGRDIGTKVFPKAELKIFMTADLDIRAKRRHDELLAKGISISIDKVKKNIEERDYKDTHRTVSPLVKAGDAIVIDNSNLNREQQLMLAVQIFNDKFSVHQR
ncbi:MAG: (d)CMP kinase [Bacteroidia bacterium]|nr:(d)CMP kinase [Bacteroidia bacterium]